MKIVLQQKDEAGRVPAWIWRLGRFCAPSTGCPLAWNVSAVRQIAPVSHVFVPQGATTVAIRRRWATSKQQSRKRSLESSKFLAQSLESVSFFYSWSA